MRPRPGNAAAALAAVWGLLGLGELLVPRVGREVATLASFGLALGLLLATRPRAGLRCATPASGAGSRRGAWLFGAGLAAGYASLPAWIALCAAALAALGQPPAGTRAPGLPSAAPSLALLALGPLLEELLYRERLLGALRPRCGSGVAVLLSAAAFAAPHGDPARLVASFGVGTVLGVSWLAARSLALCVGIHAGLNLAVLVCGTPPRRACFTPEVSALLGAAGLAVALALARGRSRVS